MEPKLSSLYSYLKENVSNPDILDEINKKYSKISSSAVIPYF